MRAVTELAFRPDQNPARELERFVRSRWSGELAVGRIKETTNLEREITLNLHRIELIYDAAQGLRIFSRTEVPDVALFKAKVSPRMWKVTGPSKEAIRERLKAQDSKMLVNSERALLGVAHQRLVQIPLVQTALSPIRNILVFLDERGSLTMRDLQKTGKSAEKIQNYLSVLTHLNYAKVERDLVVPGSEFPTGTVEMDPATVYNEMLARVLEEDYPFLQQVVRLTQMLGYLRWSNSYYLTALFAEYNVNLPIQGLDRTYLRYYPASKRSELERRGQLQRVMDSRLILRKGPGVEGDPEIADRYFDAARREGVAAA